MTQVRPVAHARVSCRSAWPSLRGRGPPVTVRLLTNIGRLWTGSEVWSNAAILTHNDRIAWVGRASELPESLPGVVEDIVDVDSVENLGGGLVTPGPDRRAHPPRVRGQPLGGTGHAVRWLLGDEIAAAGGGMASTVTVTRGTDPWTLCNGVRERLGAWLLSGTTTIEAKTGYHLTRDGELADVRMLRSLEGEPGMPRVHVTFLAAHAVPPEYFGRRHDYVDAVGTWCSDAAAAGADSVDVYCEEGRFTEREARWVLSAGRAAGLLPRVHACGETRTGAARLAAELGCASADMLHEASDEDVAALAQAGVAAVVCPGTALQTGKNPPVRAAAGQGRGGGARLRPHARRERDHLDAAGHLARHLPVRAERDRGAAGRHARRGAGPAGPGPRRDGPRPLRRHRALGRRPRRRVRLVLRPRSRAGCGWAASP